MHSLLLPNFQTSSVLVRYVEPSLPDSVTSSLPSYAGVRDGAYLHLFASVSQIFANKPPVCAFWKVNLATVLYNQVLSPRGAEPEIFAFLRKVAKDMQIGMCSAKPDDILENLWRTTAAMN
jgi:hypothetical protein